ncbi:hypothetical protein NQ317_006568 [Molorchus minor]|uniref:Uncharacterized protein n=1 Tax=Molorchus minor TaxID=1323400 RepID=A0ABQ9K0E2_9CUCU|nr:hypothetical protein NQ317_006568 [Molorchus minor]
MVQALIPWVLRGSSPHEIGIENTLNQKGGRFSIKRVKISTLLIGLVAERLKRQCSNRSYLAKVGSKPTNGK